MRAAWMAAEVLSLHGQDVSRLTLLPSSGGRFEVTVNGELVYSKAATKRFPELRELLNLIAARLA